MIFQVGDIVRRDVANDWSRKNSIPIGWTGKITKISARLGKQKRMLIDGDPPRAVGLYHTVANYSLISREPQKPLTTKEAIKLAVKELTS